MLINVTEVLILFYTIYESVKAISVMCFVFNKNGLVLKNIFH